MASGRRTKLTPERQQQIVNNIRVGMRHEDAAGAAGIAGGTFYNWKAKGREQKRGIYRDFYEALKRGEAEGERELLERIHKASISGQWTAAAWILERRHPNKWGRNVDVTSGGEVIRIAITRKDAEDADAE